MFYFFAIQCCKLKKGGPKPALEQTSVVDWVKCVLYSATKFDNLVTSQMFKFVFSLQVSLNFKEGIQHAWESRAIRKLHWMTECSPAYITLVCEVITVFRNINISF